LLNPHVLSTVISANSARGLSLTAYVLETLSYAISLAYSYRNAFPFSTYGENLFLTIQNVLITILITHHLPTSVSSKAKPGNPVGVAFVLAASTGVAYGLSTITSAQLAYLQALTLPLGLFSKLPQIAQNYAAQSTGQLSAFAVIAQVAGCAARIFTTATEVGDPLLQAGFVMALVLNLVLATQLYVYWGRDERARVPVDAPVKEKLAAKEFGWAADADAKRAEKQEKPATPEPTTVRPVTPVSLTAPVRSTSSPAPGSGRRWARKVD
jgi:mannose-P-dolichol utilization defect protein 1